MRDTLRRLIELARLDEELATCEQELSELPARREALEAACSDAEEHLRAARAALLEGEREERRLEGELADLETKLARLESQQREIKGQTAYEALLHEMTSLRDSISERETEILERMDRLEALRQSLGELERSLRESEQRREQGSRALEAREQELAKQRERLRGVRAQLAQAIERPVRERYERVRAHRQPAVVVVREELCPGCRMGIPPQAYLEVLAERALVTCATCQRIFVHEHTLQG